MLLAGLIKSNRKMDCEEVGDDLREEADLRERFSGSETLYCAPPIYTQKDILF